MSLHDERRLPFFMVTKPATATLAQSFTGRRLPVARSIYFAIVELANDARSESFAKPRKAIAERAGVNVRVLDEYVPEIENCGLLRVDRVHVEGVNLPNRWTLLDPPCAGTGGGDPEGATLAMQPTLGGSDPGDAPVKEGSTSQKQEGKDGSRSSRPVSYRGKRVPVDVVADAERLLGVFCEVAARNLSPRTRADEPSADLKQIIGALLERDGVGADEWERGIRAFAVNPPDWVDGPLQVGTVFGARASGWVLAAASGNGTAGRNGKVTSGITHGGDFDRFKDVYEN
jgi:hypothetical protein